MAFWRPGAFAAGDVADGGGDGGAEQPAVHFNPLHRLPLRAQRERLPVFAHRAEILWAVERHATTVLVGATGSGKSTQVPQFLLEAGWAAGGRVVACAQPRRVAAVTLAARVAQERGTPLGAEVGYAVRFDERADAHATRLKFLTDGVLLREAMRDPLLARYSVVMLDEAHERNLETDLLLGLLKKIQRRRPELRVIIASATLQVDTFVRFFRFKKRKHPTAPEQQRAAPPLGDVVAVSVEGRQFSVDVEYLQTPCADYLQTTIETVLAIDATESAAGDILVFLPGQEEIDFVVRALRDRADTHLLPLPFYAALPAQMQEAVFLPPPRRVRRKVIVATTIAETSVTIDGVVFVVDSCFTKLAFYNPFTGVEALVTTAVSRASAKQRAGRAGRVRPGKCFRLCTQEHFRTQLAKETIPQIQRTNLATVALYLLSMGIQDIAHFDFVSPPSPEALIRALELLYTLGAIDDACRLVEPLGTQIAEFPVEPTLAKVLLSSLQHGCTEQLLSIASMLSIGDVFLSARGSKERKEKIVEAMGAFADPDGDLLTYLRIFDEFVENGKRRDWCDEFMLSHVALSRAVELRRHLKKYVDRFKVLSAIQDERATTTDEDKDNDSDSERVAILKCFVSGYFANAAKLHPDGSYRTVRERRVVQIHPTSVYYHMGKSPDWVVFHQSVLTTDEYVRDVAKIDPRWLVAIAPDFYRTKDVSSALSGSSGTLGLPQHKPQTSSSNAAKLDSKQTTEKNSASDAPATAPDGRILFRKPAAKKASTLPVHIGKSKGGLRSQF